MDERDALAQRCIEHKFFVLNLDPPLITVFETPRS